MLVGKVSVRGRQEVFMSFSQLPYRPPAVLDDMVAALDPLNVEQLHAESAPGQFEIVTGHKEAMEVTTLLT